MRITIYRGQHQIGGTVIEIMEQDTRILLDAGTNLGRDSGEDLNLLQMIAKKDLQKAPVFISHYHGDHLGLLEMDLAFEDVYMGEKAAEIYLQSKEFKNQEVIFQPIYFYPYERIQIGPLFVTPIPCDHSAFDAYMFLVESSEKKVLYTGDFRANGRQVFENLLSELPEVDVLICEGTTLSRENYGGRLDETELVGVAAEVLRKNSGPAFILLSAMNIERIRTAYEAASQSGRLFVMDSYTALLAEKSGIFSDGFCQEKNVRICTFGGDRNYEYLQKSRGKKIGKDSLSEHKYLLCINTSSVARSYLQKLNAIQSFEDGVLFYAMWKGYQNEDHMKGFIQEMEQYRLKIHTLHTSGHADEETIMKLIQHTLPKIIMPVHTEAGEWFHQSVMKSRVITDVKEIDL